MSPFCLILTAVLTLGISRACDNRNEDEEFQIVRQDSEDYYARAYGYTPDTWNALDYQSASIGSPGDCKTKQ